MDIDTVVFSGGGLRGFAYIGAIKALYKYDIYSSCKNFAGSSVGALTAMLCALRYTPAELLDFVKYFDYEKIKDLELINFVDKYGIETGEKIESFIERVVRYKAGADVSFKELEEITGVSLTVTGTSLKRGCTIYYSPRNTPEVKVSRAVRISISIPMIFQPVECKGDYLVDGAMLTDLPIHIFNKGSTLGIRLSEEGSAEPELSTLFNYIKALWKCLRKGMEHSYDGYHVVTIRTSPNFNTFNLDYSFSQRKELLHIGYQTVATELKNLGYSKNQSENLFAKLASGEDDSSTSATLDRSNC